MSSANIYPSLFVFDMIGTTVKPTGVIPEAFISAFAREGIALTDAQVDGVRGKSKREAIAELVKVRTGATDDTLAERIYASFHKQLKQHFGGGGSPPIAGAESTFAWCRSIGAMTALTTGLDRDIVAIIIDSLGWSGKVDAVICNDDVPEGRPAPHLIHTAMKTVSIDDPAAVANAGDTVSDLQSAANAHVGWNIGVLSGAHDRNRLESVPGATIIDSVADIPNYAWVSDGSSSS